MRKILLFSLICFYFTNLSLAQVNIQIGSGTQTNTTIQSSPVNIWYESNKGKMVYTAAEINAAGFNTQGTLTQMGWYVTGVPAQTLPAYTIKMKHTTVTTAPAISDVGWTTVKSAFNYYPTAGGFDMIILDTPFAWDGTSNIAIEICFDDVNGYSQTGQVRVYSASSGYRYRRQDGIPVCAQTYNSGNNGTYSWKPQVSFDFFGPPPPAPTSITASAANVCSGAPVTLTATGVTGTVEWYSGSSCGGTLIGTGNPIIVNPTASTDYFVAQIVNGVSSLGCATTSITTSASGITNTGVITDASCDSSAIGYVGDGDIEVTTTIAAGGAAVGPFSYAWSNGGSGNLISNLGADDYVVTVTDPNNCLQIDTFTVISPDSVLTLFTPVGTSCNGVADGSATLNFTGGGTSPFDYAWSSGSSGTAVTGDNVVESGLSAGNYTVTITDNNGCVFEKPVTITEPMVLSTSSIALDGLCNINDDGVQASIDHSVVGGTMPYSYLWSSGDTTKDLLNVAAGIYELTITDANGCTTIGGPDTVTTPSDIVMILEAINNPLCFGETTGSFSISAQGGTALGVEYDSVVVSGAVVVTTTNQGTPFGSDELANKNQFVYTAAELQAAGFTAGEISEIGFDVVNPSPDTINNFKISLKQITGDPAFNGYIPPTSSYTWESGPFVEVHSSNHVISSGWNIFSTSGFFWDGTSDLVVQTCFTNTNLTNPINADVNATVAGNSNAFGSSPNWYGNPCTNEAYDGVTDVRPILHMQIFENAFAYDYLWSDGQTDTMGMNVAAGVYHVSITDLNNCLHVDSVIITEPMLLEAHVQTGNPLCNGTPGDALVTELGGTAPYNYLWNDGSTGTSTTGGPGMYTVTVTDANGCMAMDSGMINEPSELIGVITETEDVQCEGDETGMASVIADGGTPDYTYVWSNGGTGSSVSGLTNGSYDVTITDANGCTQVESTTINAAFPLPVIDLGPDRNMGFGAIDTIDATLAFVNYLWNDDPNQINSEFSWLVTNDTTFYVEVLDANGCSNSDTINYFVALGLDNVSNDLNVRIYPNPTSGLTFVEFDGVNGELVTVEVIDIQGKSVMNTQFTQTASGVQYELDLSEVSKGMYFVKLNSDSKSSVQKLAIK